MVDNQSLAVPPPPPPAPQPGEGGQEVQEAPDDDPNTIKTMDVDMDKTESEIKIKEVDGKNSYECGTCGKSFGTHRGAKSHMKAHTRAPETPVTSKASKRKERTPEQEDKKKPKTSEPEEQYKFPHEDFEKFLGGDFDTSTQQDNPEDLYAGELDNEVTLGTFDETKDAEKNETSVTVEVKTVAEEEREALLKEIQDLKELVKEKNNDLVIKDDALKILQGEKNSIEDENGGLKNQVNDLEVKLIDLRTEYEKVGKYAEKMKAMIETRKGGKENDELKERIKKLNTSITTKNKENSEANKKIKDLTDEMEKESNLKNRAEVETNRVTELMKLYKELLDKERNAKTDGNVETRITQNVQPKCRTFNKWGSCPRGDSCSFFHPLTKCQTFLNGKCDKGDECREAHAVGRERTSPMRMESKSDCSYWLDGWCRFSEEKCGRKHELTKKGSKQSDFRRGHGQEKEKGLEQELSKRCNKEQMEEILAILHKKKEMEIHSGGSFHQSGQPTQTEQARTGFQGYTPQAMVNQQRNGSPQPVQPGGSFQAFSQPSTGNQPRGSFQGLSQPSTGNHAGGTFQQSFQPTSNQPWQQLHLGGASGQAQGGGQGGQPCMVMLQPGQQVVWANPGAGGAGGRQ